MVDPSKERRGARQQRPPAANAQTISIRSLRGRRNQVDGGVTSAELLGELQLADSPEDPKRTYPASRCAFRGGYIAPKSLDGPLIAIARRAAPVVTQKQRAAVDDFFELLRSRSPYSAGLRIESPHLAAAHYCGELWRDLDRYPELRAFKQTKRGEKLQLRLQSFEKDFYALGQLDEQGKIARVLRQNDAFARGEPIEGSRHPYILEFPHLVDAGRTELLTLGLGLVSQLGRKHPGRRREDRTSAIYQAWIRRGSPEIKAPVCDELLKEFYPGEFSAARHPKVLKRLRDRVRASIFRGQKPPANP